MPRGVPKNPSKKTPAKKAAPKSSPLLPVLKRGEKRQFKLESYTKGVNGFASIVVSNRHGKYHADVIVQSINYKPKDGELVTIERQYSDTVPENMQLALMHD